MTTDAMTTDAMTTDAMTTDAMTMDPSTTPRPDEEAAAELSGRLFDAAIGALELCCAHLGLRLGLYETLAGAPGTAAELAERTGYDRRYLLEWLQQQAVAGFVTADGDDPATARFSLPSAYRAVLVDAAGPGYLGGLPEALAAVGGVLPRLVEAFRTGAPVPYAAYGPGAVSAQAALNRPAYTHALVSQWLPQLPDVAARLSDVDNPARVGDFGCGSGWSAIELAKAFPHVRVDGLDSDEASIAHARRCATDHGVAGRVDFEVADLSDPGHDWSPRYDVVFFFECLHDLPRPVEALRHARAALRPGGTVVVMDERTADTFVAPGEPVERFLAAVSSLWCLPQGLVGPDPEPVGTLMRSSTLDSLATRSGFARSEVLPIEHPVWRFYRLVP